MIDIKFWLILSFSLTLALSAGGQPNNNFDINTKQLKKAAKHAEREKDYFTAIDYYEKYLLKKEDDYKAHMSLAHMYRLTRDYRKALNRFNIAYRENEEKNVLALYYFGKMQMTQEYYDDAIITFNTFRKNYRQKKDDFGFRKLAKVMIEGCELALKDTLNAKKVYANHIDYGINMAYNEAAPLPLGKNNIIFSSIRSDTIIHFEDSLRKDTSVYRSTFHKGVRKKGEWAYEGKFEGPFEYADFNISNGCFSLDGNKFYFTKCKKNWKYEMICNIYVTKQTNEGWTEPEKLSDVINSRQFSSSQPNIGVNPKNGNEILFFSSNNPDGRGGFDLWYSERKKGELSEAKNLGGRINTHGNELTPFFDRESSTLYFSSDGHPTYGELDLFKSFGNKTKWMKNPENLGKPFNSTADDLYFIYGENADEGFFTSNREGGIALKNPTCCDDMYYFKYDEFRRFEYRSVLYTENSEIKVTSGDVQVFLRDPENGDTTYLKTVDIDKNGLFTLNVERDLNYLLIIESPDHFIQAVEIPDDGKEILIDQVDTIRLTKLTDQSFVLSNIYYDFDDWKLTNKAELAIDSFLLKILQLNAEIKVEISSHTDAKGSGLYNIRLSQKRAESVVNYLKRKGISSSRMIAKGYGKTKPIAPNTNPDGSDNPEGRQLNRRTEFKVIGFEKKIKYKKIPTKKFAR